MRIPKSLISFTKQYIVNMEKDLPTVNIQDETLEPPQKVTPNSIAALILGISSLGTSFLYGIPGIICGVIALSLSANARRKYNSNPGAYTEGSLKMINVGFKTGLIGLILSIILLVAFVSLFVWLFSSVSSGYDYYDYNYNYEYGY